MEMTINNEELAVNLTALYLLCIGQETDNCDIVIKNKKGKFNCHIEFSEVKDGNDD